MRALNSKVHHVPSPQPLEPRTATFKDSPSIISCTFAEVKLELSAESASYRMYRILAANSRLRSVKCPPLVQCASKASSCWREKSPKWAQNVRRSSIDIAQFTIAIFQYIFIQLEFLSPVSHRAGLLSSRIGLFKKIQSGDHFSL